MNEVSAAVFAIYFSGFSAHALEIDGIVYPTLEHAYHCLRFGDQEIAEEVRQARSPEAAWELSQRHKSTRSVLTDDEKIALMSRLTQEKIRQHASVRSALIDTGEMQIIKRIIAGPPGDGFWDIGSGEGRNEWGKLWMRLREDARAGLL